LNHYLKNKPMNNREKKLQEAANNLASEYAEDGFGFEYKRGFLHGANWERENNEWLVIVGIAFERGKLEARKEPNKQMTGSEYIESILKQKTT